MSRAAWAMAAAAASTMSLTTPLCADRQRPGIRVMLRNDAKVPARVLEAAQDTVKTVYHAAGVEIRWEGGPPAGTLALISADHARRMRRPHEIIGFATGSRARRGRMAYIFVHRVKELSARYRVDASVILGAVMAHELGHLLLPFDSHSEDGVMRPLLKAADFRKADAGELLFTAGQAEQIRMAIEQDASF